MRDDDALQNNPHVSRQALQALHTDLFGWALSRCDYNHSAAEDLMQQAYVEVLSGRARFNNRSALKTFVFGVVQNLARSQLRKIAIRLRIVRNHATELRQDEFSEGAENSGEHELIWQAVQALPARQRDITELVFCRDMTVADAAAVMGVTVGTGRVHYDRAKKALAIKLVALNDDSVQQTKSESK
jgi:RNA polymerase sigma-70 factor, ECF subfamily